MKQKMSAQSNPPQWSNSDRFAFAAPAHRSPLPYTTRSHAPMHAGPTKAGPHHHAVDPFLQSLSPSPQQQQQTSPIFSLDGFGSTDYPPTSFTIIDQIMREAMGGSGTSPSPFPDVDSESHSPSTSSSMSVTPTSTALPLPPPSQQQQQQPPQSMSRPQRVSPPSHNASATAVWISSAPGLPDGFSTAEGSLGGTTGYTGYPEGLSSMWHSLSKQSSLLPDVPSLNNSLSGLQNRHACTGAFASQQDGGAPNAAAAAEETGKGSDNSLAMPTVVPTLQNTSFSMLEPTSSRTSNNASHVNHNSSIGSGSNAQVIITGAVAAGAQPSSNAATHYKTKRCRHFDQSGWCPYQHRCVFAHGDREFALYTSRKKEAHASASTLRTSQQVKDHIARNVNQLVQEYEQAVAEAAANAKAKSANNNTTTTCSNNSNVGGVMMKGPTGSPHKLGGLAVGQGLTMVANLLSAQSTSQVSSSGSQHSNVHVAATGPMNSSGSVLGGGISHASASSPALFPHGLAPHAQQPQAPAVLGQPPMFLAAANTNSSHGSASMAFNGTPPSTTFTVLSGAPQPLYVGQQAPAPQMSQPPQRLTPPQQQQQQFLFAVPSGTPGLHQLQPQSSQMPQPQQQFYFLEAPYFQAIQMSSTASNGGLMAMPLHAQSQMPMQLQQQRSSNNLTGFASNFTLENVQHLDPSSRTMRR